VKNVVIGISGGIAVYKVCTLVRLLKKANINVDVIMTKNATEFVSPLTFETLSARPVVTDMFNRQLSWEVEHISLAKKADAFVICPATANVVGKIASGIADDMLTTTAMACKAPLLIAPAMNTNMYESVAFQRNLATLVSRGAVVVEPDCGFLACGDVGKGRMAEPEQIFDAVYSILYPKRDLAGKKVLITVGATAEKLDDVRFISNFSSGKMGAALAENALERGADVTIVLAKHSVAMPNTATIVDVTTTQEMYDAVTNRAIDFDIYIMAAAPCDFRPKTVANSKIKADNLTLELVKTPDIAEAVGKNKGNKKLVIFSAETDNEIANATEKLHKKNADFVVVNNIKNNDVFGSDTNVVTIIDNSGDGNAVSYAKMSKTALAEKIIDKVVTL
jgi:phosphopantothenoylcysteine decarboxylase/phosphopantothenate--cysteine ligase